MLIVPLPRLDPHRHDVDLSFVVTVLKLVQHESNDMAEDANHYRRLWDSWIRKVCWMLYLLPYHLPACNATLYIGRNLVYFAWIWREASATTWYKAMTIGRKSKMFHIPDQYSNSLHHRDDTEAVHLVRWYYSCRNVWWPVLLETESGVFCGVSSKRQALDDDSSGQDAESESSESCTAPSKKRITRSRSSPMSTAQLGLSGHLSHLDLYVPAFQIVFLLLFWCISLKTSERCDSICWFVAFISRLKFQTEYLLYIWVPENVASLPFQQLWHKL